MGSYEFSFMGNPMTFDIVTVFGLVCGLVFAVGFSVALANERRLQAAEMPRGTNPCNRR